MKKGEGKKMLLGLLAVFVLFQWTATALESNRGEAGVVVGLVAVAAMLFTQRVLFRESYTEAARSIGLARPNLSGIIVAIVIATLMFASVALFVWQTRSAIEMYPGWPLLMIGIFFQAGMGEETLFRGYLFGHLRQRHTFGKAVFFAAIPFVLVHLILFYSLPWSLAGASILLSIGMSFPFSKLYEISGGTIWAPAIVHFAAQAVGKMFVPSGEHAWLYPFFVISVSAVVPLGVYLVPKSRGLLYSKKEFGVAATLFLVVVVSTPALNGQASDWSAGIPACMTVASTRTSDGDSRPLALARSVAGAPNRPLVSRHPRLTIAETRSYD